jgi:mono/diheme cytochrome c family protein
MRGRLLAAAALALFAPTSEAAEPNYNYALRCTGCHTAEGISPEAGRIPPLKGVVGHLVRTEPARLYFVNVPGIVNAALSDEEMAALLNWVVTTYGETSIPAEWKRFDAAEIRSLRAKAPADIIVYRKEVAEQLKAGGFLIGTYP